MNPKIVQIVELLEQHPEKLQNAVNLILGTNPSDEFLDGLILGLTEPPDLALDVKELLDADHPNFVWSDTYKLAITGISVAFQRDAFHADNDAAGIDASAFANGATALFTQPEFTQMPTETLIVMQDWFNAGQDAVTGVINARLPVSE